jgi:hypothetical protein
MSVELSITNYSAYMVADLNAVELSRQRVWREVPNIWPDNWTLYRYGVSSHVALHESVFFTQEGNQMFWNVRQEQPIFAKLWTQSLNGSRFEWHE